MTQDDPARSRSGYKPRRAVRRRSRVPLYLILGAVAVVAIVGIFFLGLAIAGWVTPRSDQSATPTPTSTPTPTPTVTAPPVGPVAPGTYAWNELGGGECLTGYTTPWAEEFTVVDCAVPHDAQLVRRGALPGIPGAPYPGDAAITEQMTLLCTDPAVLDLDAAARFTWVQWQAAYPPNVDEWNKGERAYFCFFNRSSGEQLTGSIVNGP